MFKNCSNHANYIFTLFNLSSFSRNKRKPEQNEFKKDEIEKELFLVERKITVHMITKLFFSTSRNKNNKFGFSSRSSIQVKLTR